MKNILLIEIIFKQENANEIKHKILETVDFWIQPPCRGSKNLLATYQQAILNKRGTFDLLWFKSWIMTAWFPKATTFYLYIFVTRVTVRMNEAQSITVFWFYWMSISQLYSFWFFYDGLSIWDTVWTISITGSTF